MPRFVCVGDLHLEKGADLGVGSGDRLREQETVWESALALARDTGADAILFAGDAFDKASPRPDAILAFERPIVNHRHLGGCPIIAIEGNHDRNGTAAGTALAVMAEAGLIDLAWGPDLFQVAGVCIARLPWTPVSRLVAAQGGGDRDDTNQVAARMLVDVARDLRAHAPDGPSILLTHFSISDTEDAHGGDVGLFREVVLPLPALQALGFDWIVAGHIHRPQGIGGCGSYVGSPMPLDFGEAHFEHGVTVLDVDTADGEVAATFVPIPSRRLVNLEMEHADHLDALVIPKEAKAARDAIVKVKITATAEQARRLDLDRLKHDLVHLYGAAKVWKVVVDVERETRARAEGIDETLSEIDAVDLYIEAQGLNGSTAPALRAITARYLEELTAR